MAFLGVNSIFQCKVHESKMNFPFCSYYLNVVFSMDFLFLSNNLPILFSIAADNNNDGVGLIKFSDKIQNCSHYNLYIFNYIVATQYTKW